MSFLKWLDLFMPHFGGGGGGDTGAKMQQEDETRKAALRAQVNSLFGAGGAVPQTFVDEEGQVAQGLRSKYADEGKLAYQKAERDARFGAANTGNIGGSAYADAMSQLGEQNRTGATRIEDAVQRAINGLRSGRENARLNAISLVNSGTGQEAVQAAQQGLQGSFNNAKVANQEQLFNDLFQNVAFTKSVGDMTDRERQLAAIYGKPKSSIVYPTADSTGRTITY